MVRYAFIRMYAFSSLLSPPAVGQSTRITSLSFIRITTLYPPRNKLGALTSCGAPTRPMLPFPVPFPLPFPLPPPLAFPTPAAAVPVVATDVVAFGFTPFGSRPAVRDSMGAGVGDETWTGAAAEMALGAKDQTMTSPSSALSVTTIASFIPYPLASRTAGLQEGYIFEKNIFPRRHT